VILWEMPGISWIKKFWSLKILGLQTTRHHRIKKEKKKILGLVI